MTVNTPIPFSRSNILPIGAPSPRNDQEAVPVPVHSMAHTTRHLDIGGLRTDTIPILGDLLLSSASRCTITTSHTTVCGVWGHRPFLNCGGIECLGGGGDGGRAH